MKRREERRGRRGGKKKEREGKKTHFIISKVCNLVLKNFFTFDNFQTLRLMFGDEVNERLGEIRVGLRGFFIPIFIEPGKLLFEQFNHFVLHRKRAFEGRRAAEMEDDGSNGGARAILCWGSCCYFQHLFCFFVCVRCSAWSTRRDGGREPWL